MTFSCSGQCSAYVIAAFYTVLWYIEQFYSGFDGGIVLNRDSTVFVSAQHETHFRYLGLQWRKGKTRWRFLYDFCVSYVIPIVYHYMYLFTNQMPISLKAFPSQFKFDEIMFCSHLEFLASDRYKILHMARQLRCRDMCKILLRCDAR